MKFGSKPTMADKMAVASRNKSGKAQDKKPLPKAEIKLRPTGGLKALQGKGGVKIKIEKRF